MTFAEKLDRARSGSRAAYESLCLGSVDSLYTAALIALKNGSAAENAVKSAINDGYAGISRIKDERHLRSWLVHELTKHIVEKLKEFKASGISNKVSGKFAATDILPDVERLVFSVSACFGYGTKELSVLTGMSESAAAEKLASAGQRLGPEYKSLTAAARENKAPEMLTDKYRMFDESLERIKQEEQPAPEPAPEPKAEEAPFLQEIPMQPKSNVPDNYSSRQLPSLHEIEEEQKKQQEELPQNGTSAASEPAEQSSGAENTAEFSISGKHGDEEEEVSVFADENAELAALPAGQSASEMFSVDESSDNDNPPVINAETFIGVVSAEQIKGSEFLRLIGNTRISNNVYREIEQNPRLTKKRLIELLEQSPLNDADYIKLLTAIKHRREIINAKEESRLIHERAGLFDGSQRSHSRRRHAREIPKTELQMAIEENTPKKDIPLTMDEKRIVEDDFDYEIKTSSDDRRGFAREESFRDERIPIITSNQKSLGAIINEVSRSKNNGDKTEAFHPAEMEGIFHSMEIEAVDPIAAIYAKETGDQVKPVRIENIHNEWADSARRQKDVDADKVDNSSGTQEFELKAPAPEKTFDTREFDSPGLFEPEPETVSDPLEFSEGGNKPSAEKQSDLFLNRTSNIPDIQEKLDMSDSEQNKQNTQSGRFEMTGQPEPETPAASGSTYDYDDTESEIETIPVSASEGMSVTQIITEYSGKASDGAPRAALPGASDVTTILEGIPKQRKYVMPLTAAEQAADAADGSDDGAYSPGDFSDKPAKPVRQEKAEPAEEPVTKPEETPEAEKEPVPKKQGELTADDIPGGFAPRVSFDIFDTMDFGPDDTDIGLGSKKQEKRLVFSEPGSDDDDNDDNDDEFASRNKPSKKEKHRDEEDEPVRKAFPAPQISAADEEELPEKAGFEINSGDENDAGFDVGYKDDADDTDDAAYREEPDDRDDDDDEDDKYDGDIAEKSQRERYKGNEYFPDDDEYYEGVNRGKTIFCLICAALLVAGALSMKFVFNKDKNDVLPDDNGGNTSVSETTEPAVTEAPETNPADDSEILTHLTEFENSEPYQISQLSSQYLRSSAEPYAPFLSKSIIRTDNTLYIFNDGKIKAVSLDPDEPKVIAETALKDRSEELFAYRGGNYVSRFLGCTIYNGKLYAVSQVIDRAAGNAEDRTEESGNETAVYVEIFSPDLTSDGDYYIDGKYCGMGIAGGKLVAVTYMMNRGLHFETGKPVLLPTAKGSETKEPSDIIKLNGAETNGFAVIGEVGGSGFTVISGCIMCYPKFDGGDGFTLLCADKSQTFAVNINSALEAASAKRYAGRAFSEDCLNGDSFIGADLSAGKANGVAVSVGDNALTTGVADETPCAVAWTDDGKTACVLARQVSGAVMLYGFDMSGEKPVSANVTSENVYTERLISAGGMLVGLKAEAAADGERAGLRFSRYEYSGGKLVESAHTVIGLDDSSPRENLKYIRSPAESDTAFIAAGKDGLLAVPTYYFDGFSEVERIAVFDSTLSQAGEIMLYDEKSSVLYAAFSEDKLFVVTDRHIIVAEISGLSEQKVYDIS